MPWNEPGGGKDQDPWGRKKDEGPPDLDELVRKMQAKFGGVFGKRGGSGGGGGSRRGGPAMGFGIGLLVVIGLVVWALSGIYIIDSAERGVVLRFGEYQQTVGPGPHWHIPYPVEQVYKVNVDAVRDVRHRAQMLTKDENLISIGMAVQYQVKNAEDYLFNVRDPDYTLRQVTESGLREVVGSRTFDDILGELGGRQVLVNETQQQIQTLLDRYGAGLRVTKVNLESAQPPQEVQAAFEDAIKAREDKDRLKKQAEAYARDVIPKAEGDAERIEQEAEAYRRQVVDAARGETSRFMQVLTEYSKAPEITRRRLYLETMEQVLANVSKVLVKVEQGNNILYLPLDRSGAGASTAAGAAVPMTRDFMDRSAPVQLQSNRRDDDVRGREGR